LLQSSYLIDTITNTVTGAAGLNITFGFHRYYFVLQDTSASPNNITANVSMTVAGNSANNLGGNVWYYDTTFNSSDYVVVENSTCSIIVYVNGITPTTVNVLKLNSIISFTPLSTATSDMAYDLSVVVGSNTYDLGAGCYLGSTNAGPHVCSVPDDLSAAPTIAYSISLMQSSLLVDVRSNTATGAVGGLNIPYVFNRYYFLLQDQAASHNNVTVSKIALTISGNAVTAETLFSNILVYNTNFDNSTSV
jgi:hypothetical protein